MQVNINDLQVVVSRLSGREGSAFPVISAVTGADSGRDTSSAGAVIPGIDCQGLYDESFINLRRGQYEEAIQGFADYLRYCGEQDLADNARFWIGESYYSTDMYKEAITEFDLLLKNYPQSEKRPGALYKKARSLEELGQKQDAKKTFQKLVDEFPGTLEAEQAKEKLKELD
jgi:tol-pal system protein YbgF